jgi:predicted AAA+ superfamily ATPase
MPEIILEQNEDLRYNYTKNLVNSIILKDIVARHKV